MKHTKYLKKLTTLIIVLYSIGGVFVGYGIGNAISISVSLAAFSHSGVNGAVGTYAALSIIFTIIGGIVGFYIGKLFASFYGTIAEISENLYALKNPDAKSEDTYSESKYAYSDRISQLVATSERTNKWVCQNCGMANESGNLFCKGCGQSNSLKSEVSFTQQDDTNTSWVCQNCGTTNERTNIFCKGCGKAR